MCVFGYFKLTLSLPDALDRQTSAAESAKNCAELCITEILRYSSCIMLRLIHTSVF